VLSTDRKGSIAEIAIAEAAIRLGVDVYKPLNDGTRCDLIFDLAGRLTRVQCKWAARYGEVLIVRCARNRRTREGLLSRRYTIDEVDPSLRIRWISTAVTSSLRSCAPSEQRLGPRATTSRKESTGPSGLNSALHWASLGP
jgi:PD-(D/E)XK endonuclease